MALIAIEFGTTQALVASARVSGKRLQVQNLFSVEFDGDDTDAAAALKSALAKNGLARSDAIVVMGRSSVEMRELTVPPAPDRELPDMVRFIAKNEFASLNDNWDLDFVPLSDDPSVSRKVLAAAISPELKTQITTVAELAGLKIRHLVLRPYSIIELVRGILDDGKGQLIVDTDGDQVNMTIVLGDQLIGARTVRVPSKGTDSERAEFLLSEIRRTLASFKSILAGKPVERAIVLGRDSDYRTLKARLDAELNLSVHFDLPLDRLAVRSGLGRPDNESRFSALIGALVRQNAKRKPVIDFFNPRKPAVKKNENTKTYTYCGLAAAVALLVVGFAWWTLSSQESTIANLESDHRKLVAKNKGENGRPAVDQVIGEVAKIDQWELSDINWLEELYQYSDRSLTADDVIVDSFEAEINRRASDDPRIIVNTRAATAKGEADLFNSLKERPFNVKPRGGRMESNDKDYPHINSLRISLVQDAFQRLKDLDAKAIEFQQQQLVGNGAAKPPADNEPDSTATTTEDPADAEGD